MPGRIGYAWPQSEHPDLCYTAFSNEADGSRDMKAIKPLPVEAIHGVRDGNPDIRSGITPDGSDAAILSRKGDAFSYPVNVRQDGNYMLSVNVSKASAGSTLVIKTDGTLSFDLTFKKASSDDIGAC